MSAEAVLQARMKLVYAYAMGLVKTFYISLWVLFAKYNKSTCSSRYARIIRVLVLLATLE